MLFFINKIYYFFYFYFFERFHLMLYKFNIEELKKLEEDEKLKEFIMKKGY
jgi:hypothetical protein